MMRKSFGPLLVIDTNPPYRPWDENQATILFFPVLAAFVLMLLSMLSIPIVPGLSVVNVDTGVNGTIKVGSWGWCSSSVPGYDNNCSSHRAFDASIQAQLDALPEPVRSLADISGVVNGSYLIAMGVMHLLACLAMWLTITWTLASSGAWRNKDPQAWDWTRWAFAGTFWSSLFTVIAWGLQLGMMTRVKSHAKDVDGSQPSVRPGPAIFMLMSALICTLACFIARVAWGKFRPRPEWTMKGSQGDFHNPSQAPLSAALPPADEQPPTWESFNIDDAKEVVLNDQEKMRSHSQLPLQAQAQVQQQQQSLPAQNDRQRHSMMMV